MSRINQVLVIEDDLDYRTLVERWLGDEYALRFGTRLDDTWHELDRCDLILLDLGLPDARGLETLVAARELAANAPIVVLTGLEADEALCQRAADAGADAFLPKSQANAESLRQALEEALANRGKSATRNASTQVSAAFAKSDSWLPN